MLHVYIKDNIELIYRWLFMKVKSQWKCNLFEFLLLFVFLSTFSHSSKTVSICW